MKAGRPQSPRLGAAALIACAAGGLAWFWLALPSPAGMPGHAVAHPLEHAIDHTQATMGCETLTLAAKDVETYFSTAAEVSASRFDAEAIILPCSVSGTLTKGGKRYAWRIHAAGAGYLTEQAARSESKRFLCGDACEKALPALMGH
ncbi:hypothetical protein [Acidovorax sp. SUPP3334]|uniref:hypothetical protein n=1 Tax=Acidovorax sp. SUPP3334 TaxID=2920881 RepID=UPI0024E044DC|nr:hypothetical protein [Acidovorax sp. SUPP3334]